MPRQSVQNQIGYVNFIAPKFYNCLPNTLNENSHKYLYCYNKLEKFFIKLCIKIFGSKNNKNYYI